MTGAGVWITVKEHIEYRKTKAERYSDI